MSANFKTIIDSDGTRHTHPCHDFSGSAGLSCWEDVVAAARAGKLVTGRMPGHNSSDSFLTDSFLSAVVDAGFLALPGPGSGGLQAITVGLADSFPAGVMREIDDLLATKITRRP